MTTTHFFASAAKAAFALAAVCTLSFALASCSDSDDNVPEEQYTNTLTIDGDTKPIIDARIMEKHFIDKEEIYEIGLKIEERKYIKIGVEKKISQGRTVDLTKKEDEQGDDKLIWYIRYHNPKTIFDATSFYPWTPAFISGTLYAKRLPDADGQPVFEIVLKNGKVKNKKPLRDGDGDEHTTVSLSWKGSLEWFDDER